MSVNISGWLLEDIDEKQLESNTPITPLATDDAYVVYGNAYYNYYDYSVYYNYYDYSVYYNYYDYYNYSNSISVTRHPISQSVQLSELVTFSVGASNTIDSCQWYVATSATGAGTAIAGATLPNLTLTVTRDMDNTYYYCIVRRGGNSSTSNRALLTVMTVDVFDIYVTVDSSANMFFVRANPPTTTIVSATVENPNIATVTSEGVITGVSVGTTTCTLTGSNGVSSRFTITVLPANNILVAILMNTAIALREYKSLSHSIYPNQMANILRGNVSSKPYTTLDELFTDIADAIRELESSTGKILPSSFYHRILALTTL